jgi:multidrug resistance protein, MATE family
MTKRAEAGAGTLAVPAVRYAADGSRHVDLKAIFALAGPLMISNAAQALINLTDTWFIGRLSTEAVAAMSAIYWLLTCVILVLGGVGLAVQTFVAQAEGSRRRPRAAIATWCALWAAIATIPLFLLLAWAGPWLLRPFGLSPDVEALALAYWEPRMAGAVLGSVAWALMGFFNGIGATRFTIAVVAVMTLANVPANQILMFEFGLGMAGAAWGTNVAQLVGVLIGLAIFLSGERALRYRSRVTWQPNWGIIKRQLLVGLPIGVMYGADVLGVALAQLMVVQVSSVGAAATQVVMMLTSLAYMPTLGIATAGTTLVGQSIGAGDKAWAARVGNVTITMCAGLMGGIALLLVVCGPWVVPQFISAGDSAAASAIALALTLLWPAAAYQVFDGLYFGSSFAMRGAGDTRVPAATAIVLSWGIYVPLAHTLVFAPGQGWIDGLPQVGLGALGAWLALMTYAILLGLSMFVRWRSGRWRAISLT